MTEQVQGTNVVEATPLTREQKLRQKYDNLVKLAKQYIEKAEEIKAELESASLLASIGIGSEVVVVLGRAETTREVVGTIIGVKEEEDGSKKFKVQYGEGFDADIAVVGSAKIKPVPPKAEEAAPASA